MPILLSQVSSTQPLAKVETTDSECNESTLPVPPNRSFPHPKYTARIRYCIKADAHMTHGSTVT